MKTLSSFSGLSLTRPEMKEITGGYTIYCQDECYYYGTTKPQIVVGGGCASSDLSACKSYGVNGALLHTFDYCGHSCWPI